MEERNEANDSGEQTEAERAYRWPPTDGNVIPDDATYIIVDEPGLEPSVIVNPFGDGRPCLSGFKQLKRVDIAPRTKHLSRYIMSHCTKLEEIDIPDTVRSIGTRAFTFCLSLRKVRLPNNENFHTIKAKTFLGCGNLTSVEIPSTVHTIEKQAFGHCRSLKQITLPDSVEIIERGVFLSYSLQTIRLPNNPNLCVQGDSFTGCPFLYSIIRPLHMSQEQWLHFIQDLNQNYYLWRTLFIGSPPPAAALLLHTTTGGFNDLGHREFLATIPVELWPKLFSMTSSSLSTENYSEEFVKSVKSVTTVNSLIFQHLRKHTGVLLDSRMRRARRRPRRLGFE